MPFLTALPLLGPVVTYINSLLWNFLWYVGLAFTSGFAIASCTYWIPEIAKRAMSHPWARDPDLCLALLLLDIDKVQVKHVAFEEDRRLRHVLMSMAVNDHRTLTRAEIEKLLQIAGIEINPGPDGDKKDDRGKKRDSQPQKQKKGHKKQVTSADKEAARQARADAAAAAAAAKPDDGVPRANPDDDPLLSQMMADRLAWADKVVEQTSRMLHFGRQPDTYHVLKFDDQLDEPVLYPREYYNRRNRFVDPDEFSWGFAQAPPPPPPASSGAQLNRRDPGDDDDDDRDDAAANAHLS